MDRATFFKHFDLLADQADAVAKMRGVVLELAIQGKVVAQNSKDEPASKLLERVCAHSAATDNARAKKSRDEIESLVPTEFWHLVPASWVVAPLGTVTNIIRGITFPSSAKGKIREKGTVACLRTANVQDVIEWDDLLFIPENYVGRDDQWLKPNDLVISMANSAALVGKVAQAREVPEKASFGGFLAVIRPIELDSTYLLYFLRAPSVQAALRATSSQTTNIANISLGGMRPMPVAVPPLAEQRRIVAKVDELMALCDELEQRQQERQHASGLLQQSALHHLLAAREPQTFAAAWQRVRDHFHILHDTPDAIPQLRQAILQLAVEGRLMTQDEKDKPASEMLESLRVHQSRFVKDRLAKPYTAPEITDKEKFVPSLPEGWQWARLKQLGYFCVGATPSMNKSDYWGDGVPWVTPKDMKSPRIKGSEMSVTKLALEETRLRMLPKKSVLIVGRSGILKRLLPVAVTDIECVVNQDMKVLVPFTPELGDYIRVMLCGFQTFILENLVKGGMTVQSLKYDEFEEQPFPLPPLAEQKRIVARVEELLWWCDTLEAQLRQTRTLGAHLLASTLHHLLAA